MTLALRAVLCGVVTALIVELLIVPMAWALFVAYVLGMLAGLGVSWFCWPWEKGPE